MARIRAVSRRPSAMVTPSLRLGRLEFDFESLQAQVEGQPLALPRRQVLVLQALAMRQGARSPQRWRPRCTGSTMRSSPMRSTRISPSCARHAAGRCWRGDPCDPGCRLPAGGGRGGPSDPFDHLPGLAPVPGAGLHRVPAVVALILTWGDKDPGAWTCSLPRRWPRRCKRRRPPGAGPGALGRARYRRRWQSLVRCGRRQGRLA